MINILLPLAGASIHFDKKEYPYPTALIELIGKPMIEQVIENLKPIGSCCRFIFVVRQEDCRRFHLDNTLKLIAPENSVVLKLEKETGGALCSALLAVQYIDTDQELIIANGDQLFEKDLGQLVNQIRDRSVDAGCICFESVHPRWSYVRISDGFVVEAAEKNPISRNAIAGFYYFRQGRFFVDAAKSVISNGCSVDGRYYISPTFNELILAGRSIYPIQIQSNAYHSFFTPQRIADYTNKQIGLDG